MRPHEPKAGQKVALKSGTRVGTIIDVLRRKNERVKVQVRWDHNQIEEWVLSIALRFIELNADKPLQSVLWSLVRKHGTTKVHVRHEGSINTLCNRLIEDQAEFAQYDEGGADCQYCLSSLEEEDEAKKAQKKADSILDKTWEFCTNNIELVAESTRVGCFSCLIEIEPSDLQHWTDEGRTAICPRCMVDAILPNAAPLPVGIDVLRAMKARFVDGLPKDEDEDDSPLLILLKKELEAWQGPIH